MNKENMNVLTNIIGAVETGGQIYGKKRYDDYTAPYTNTPKEHTITLGWAQNYGDEARKLIRMIFDADPDGFHRIDVCSPSIESMLTRDWVDMRWNPSTTQKKVLIALIDSDVGHKVQDELFGYLMEAFIRDCEKTYTSEIPAEMMYCEIRHLGGKGAADRIFKRCAENYSLDGIMSSLKKDQNDTSSTNQVGDKKFWSRHEKCVEFIKRYAVEESNTISDTDAKSDPMTKKETIMTPMQRAKKLLYQPQSDVMTGYTPDGKQCFVDAGAFSKIPKKGDVIYFYSTAKGRVGHVGIVERVDASEKIVHTIEGNTTSDHYAENGGCVARHQYSYAAQGGTNRVNGFGHPNFAAADVTADEFVEMARSQLGYLEKKSNKDLDSKTANAGSNNYQKFQRDVGAGNGDQWCQYFVDAVALYTCQGHDPEPKPTLNEDPKWEAVVDTDSLNVRTWAGMGNPTVSFSPLKKGTKIGVCDELNDDGGRKWYYIQYQGKHGFVYAKYVKKDDDPPAPSGPKRKTATAVMTAAVRSVADKARVEGWTYGDSHSSIPCAGGKISCDRLIARALYEMGFRDQRCGGEVCSTLDNYLTGHGWTKVTRRSKIKGGAVVAVRSKDHNYIDHVFYVSRYDKTMDTCNKFDMGSNERIRTKQPYKMVPLVEWKDKIFVCAWIRPAYLCTAMPGIYVFGGIDYAPVFNATYYWKMNADIEKSVGRNKQKLFEHFLKYGMNEGRRACAAFDPIDYRNCYPDLAKKYGDNLKEYYKDYCRRVS